MKNFEMAKQKMAQSVTAGAVERERERERVYILNVKNENAISLIALIITIIVIIILAAVVIDSSLSTPEQANFARFSSDFSEIESAVKTTYATEYGKVMMNNQNATKSQIYQGIATGTNDY